MSWRFRKRRARRWGSLVVVRAISCRVCQSLKASKELSTDLQKWTEPLRYLLHLLGEPLHAVWPHLSSPGTLLAYVDSHGQVGTHTPLWHNPANDPFKISYQKLTHPLYELETAKDGLGGAAKGKLKLSKLAVQLHLR
jgi:hypothetical protein